MGALTLQVNTSGAWKNVLTFERAQKADVVAAVKRLAAAVPEAEWCILAAGGKREWLKRLAASEKDSMRTLDRAVAIADTAARSDIELYAHGVRDERRGVVWDITQAGSTGAGETEATMATQALIAQRAVDYIRSRPEGTFPWRLRHDEAAPHLVWFEDKPEKKGKARGRV